MSCTKCKKKSRMEEMYNDTKDVMSSKMLLGVSVWSLLGLYGLYEIVISVYELF